MELKIYLRVILKYWWIIVGAFIFTLVPTYLFVNSQPWIYESAATFVIRPRSDIAANDDEIVDALDTLSRRVEINSTFAEFSSSSLIKQQAIERLALSPEVQQGLKVNGRVIAGTNILEISVQGPNPEIVQTFANAVSQETLTYVSNLYDVFELGPLDAADLPTAPVSPNKSLNLALGGGLGLLLGIGLIFFVEYLKEPVQATPHVNIVDAETGAYNHPYFVLRLRQELSRARHNNYSFSLALIKVYQRGLVYDVAEPIPPAKALRLILTYLDPNLREEDTLAYAGQNMFALLLPHMPGEAAADLLSFLRSQISLISPNEIDENQATAICCSIGIVVSHLHTAPGEMLAQAVRALEEAETAVYGKVHLYTQTDTLTHHANGRSTISTQSTEAVR
jgi:capsular polysaccharide biosynthesis protein